MSLPVDEFVPRKWRKYTNRGSTGYTLLWELQHMIRNVQKCGEFIESETMHCDRAEASTSLKLRLFCRGDQEEANNYFSLHIVADPAVDIKDLFYHLIFVNRKKGNLTFADKLDMKDGCLRLSKLVSWHTIFDSESGFVPEKVLTISMRVIIFDHVKPLDVFTYTYKQLEEDETGDVDETGDLAGNLGRKMLFNKDFSDVIIKAGGEDIPAHGCILSASWPYFHTNYWPLDKSKVPLVLSLQVEAEHMKKILRFLYTGERPQLDNQSAMSMMNAAVNHEFDRLRDACKEYLMDHLNNAVAVDVLLMAEKFKMIDLKRKCISFLLMRKDSSWIDALQDNGKIMLEIFKQSKEDPSCMDIKMEIDKN